MLYPTIHQLTDGDFNRYELVIATAKCARMVTDEYVRQREAAEKAVADSKESEKVICNMIDKEYRDEKAVKVAISHIRSGDFVLSHAKSEEDEPTPDTAEDIAQ
ncbi:MAG: hypothetical protein IIX15_03575 [Clostridia bacterium]|nr:hypothetical protein [Clostridia bacterium]